MQPLEASPCEYYLADGSVGGVRRSLTQALASLEAWMTSDQRKHTEK